jgi:GNAT superfamily N-acetyltransferase
MGKELIMRRIKKEEITQIVPVLTSAFSDYEQIQYIFGDLKKKDYIVSKVFEGQMRALFDKGDIYVTDDLKAVCFGYSTKRISIIRIMLKHSMYTYKYYRQLTKDDYKRLARNSKKSSGINNLFWQNKYVKKPYYYIMTVGVDPSMQGKGILKQLLNPIIEQCNKENMPIIIETHREINVHIYEKFGFQLVRTFSTKDKGLSKYCMVRYADK